MISVIVPVYNSKMYLEECFDSILNQSFGDLEIIVVDDGSSDGSSELCDLYAQRNSRIKVIHQVNQGPSKARNAGLNNATGDFVVFVDSDDFIPSNYIKDMYESHIAHDGKRMIVARLKKFETIYEQMMNHDSSENVALQDECLERSRFLILNANDLLRSQCNKIYDNHVIRTNNLHFDEDVMMGEDYIFNLKYIECLDFEGFIVKNLFYYYREGISSSITSSFHENLYETMLKQHLMEMELGARIGSPNDDLDEAEMLWKGFCFTLLRYYCDKRWRVSLARKISMCTRIMRENKLGEAVSKNKRYRDYMNKLIWPVYTMNNYLFVWFVESVIYLPRNIMRVVCGER